MLGVTKSAGWRVFCMTGTAKKISVRSFYLMRTLPYRCHRRKRIFLGNRVVSVQIQCASGNVKLAIITVAFQNVTFHVNGQVLLRFDSLPPTYLQKYYAACQN